MTPGRRWRLLAHERGEPVRLENRGVFDELVVGEWLHIEQLDRNVWWLSVGDKRLVATVGKDGHANVACWEESAT